MIDFLSKIHRFLTSITRPSKEKNVRLLKGRGESISSFKIREATSNDISSLAALHVKTWHQTYPFVLSPPAYQLREAQWRKQFELNDGSWFCFVVENKSGDLVGFAKGQVYNHKDLPQFSGELNKIYLLRSYQRLGLGRKLMGFVARRFLSMGISNMVLFGTAGNPSNAFHEVLGGERLYGTNGAFHGGYCWKDLSTIASIY